MAGSKPSRSDRRCAPLSLICSALKTLACSGILFNAMSPIANVQRRRRRPVTVTGFELLGRRDLGGLCEGRCEAVTRPCSAAKARSEPRSK